MFNWSEVHFFGITSYEIHTLVVQTEQGLSVKLRKCNNFEEQSTNSRETQFSPRKWQILRQKHWSAMVRKTQEMYCYLNTPLVSRALK